MYNVNVQLYYTQGVCDVQMRCYNFMFIIIIYFINTIFTTKQYSI